jgi:hypothetical protein
MSAMEELMDKNNSGKTHGKIHSWYGFASPRTARRLAFAGAALAVLVAAVSPASAEPKPERSLAGIAIFSPGSLVTHKFGNPNQILVGGAAAAPFSIATGTSGSASGPGGAPGAPGGYPGGQGGFPGAPGGASSPGSLPGFSGGGRGAPGGFPGAPGGYPGASGGFPGAPGGFPGAPGGFPGAPGSLPGSASGFPGSDATAAPVKPPVTLIYNRPNGGSLEITISPDKRVVQIRETGYSGAYGTARGIKLGTSYSAVVARYGYPENTEIAGSIVNIDYKDTLHCGFQFLDQRLVGIIVVSPD